MFGTNSVFIVGTLGREPDPTVFENSSEVSNFTVATTDPITQQTVWHRIVAKGALANLCNNCLQKSSVVSIIGHLTYRDYIDNYNNKKTVTEIHAHKIDIITNRKTENHRNSHNQNNPNNFGRGSTNQSYSRTPFKMAQQNRSESHNGFKQSRSGHDHAYRGSQNHQSHQPHFAEDMNPPSWHERDWPQDNY